MSTKAEISSRIRAIYNSVQKEQNELETQRLQNFLSEKRDAVLHKAKEKRGAQKLRSDPRSGERKTFLQPLRPTTPLQPPAPVHSDRPWTAVDSRQIVDANAEPTGELFFVQQRTNESKEPGTFHIPCRKLQTNARPLRKHVLCIALARNIHVEDTTGLTYAPYLGELHAASIAESDEKPAAKAKDTGQPLDLFDLYDTSYREGLLIDGAEYDQAQKNIVLFNTLTRSLKELGLWPPNTTAEASLSSKALKHLDVPKTLQSAIANIMSIRPERVKIVYENLMSDQLKQKAGTSEEVEKESTVLCEDTSLQVTDTSNLASVPDEEMSIDKDVTSQNETPKPSDEDTYLKGIDSYRSLYCRRCFVYDCPIHGAHEKAKPDVQFDIAIYCEREGMWDGLDDETTSKLSELLSDDSLDPFQDDNIKELSMSQKALCKRLFQVYEGNINAVAFVLKAPRIVVREFVIAEKYEVPDLPYVKENEKLRRHQIQKQAKMKYSYHSTRNYHVGWCNAIEKAEIHPFFYPCTHEAPCSDKTCSCIQNNYFCTTACVWGRLSRNFFRGCECKGHCVQNQCTCYASKRECDPDLCLCQTCCDPPGKPPKSQRCRNDNIGMHRHAHVVVGRSSVSGWGLFTKHALKRGDYIIEYTGEMISQEEAERRGQIDDTLNRSYMFNLCSDFVLDASRKANKARFINHSDTPNCQTKTLFVKGDQRIGLFACKDIPAQSELFFDYRYNVSMDNERLVKPAMSFDWMKDAASESKKPEEKKKKSKKRYKRRK